MTSHPNRSRIKRAVKEAVVNVLNNCHTIDEHTSKAQIDRIADLIIAKVRAAEAAVEANLVREGRL